MSDPTPDLRHSSATLRQADATAAAAHQGQTRRHGAPYVDHVRGVWAVAIDLADAAGVDLDESAQAAALLHDVVEDSAATVEQIAADFGPDTARHVDLLTKHAGKKAEYWPRLRAEATDVTRLLKCADRLHNLSELHLRAEGADADVDRAARYLQETVDLLVPIAGETHSVTLRRALLACLDDGITCAVRATGAPAPAGHTPRTRPFPVGLYPIVGVTAAVHARVQALLDAGARIVQLRDKHSGDRERYELAVELAALCERRGAWLIVNDRADIAVAASAHGVHGGQTDLPATAIRRVVGPSLHVGASSHTRDQLEAACQDGGADHVAFGPVFASPTKQGHADVTGTDALQGAVAVATLPVVAIGGITSPARMAEVARCGARLGAVVSAVDSDDPRALARRLHLSFLAARAAAGLDDSAPVGPS